jgi:peptidoglycan/LPS O-acetylase OafA/YrhL
MKKINFIQTLRGIAAMLVVLYHIREIIVINGIPVGEYLFASGAAGVDLFFMISGFIMVYSTQQMEGGVQDTKRFFINRLIRVLPLYIIATVGFIYITQGSQWFSAPGHFKQLAKAFLFYPANAVDGAPFYGYPPLYVGWTLNYEMFFYLLFGLSLLGGRWRWWILSGLSAILLVIIPLLHGSFTINANTDQHYSIGYLNLITNSFIYEFLFGAVLAAWYNSKIVLPKVYAGWLLVAGIGLYAWQYFSFVRYGHGPTHWGLSTALLLAAIVTYDKTSSIRVAPVWITLGNISYSLYLLHPLVKSYMPQFFDRYQQEQLALTPSYVFLYVTLTVLVSLISYACIEQGLGNLLKKKMYHWFL